jgi:N-methylhydantoinase B/oxoprolinase/acetone carboxylase alpha subunit
MMGGGYGDPLKRDVERVLNYIVERYASPKTAHDI